MSELIVLIHRKTGTRRFQRTLEDTTPKQVSRGCHVGLPSPTYRLASP